MTRMAFVALPSGPQKEKDNGGETSRGPDRAGRAGRTE
jgi:hypothetical protein